MALLHTYGTSNQVVTKLLDTYYTKTQIGTTGDDPVYENHRVTSKKWSWVGLDEATARACIRLTREKYTRTLTRYYTSGGTRSPSTYQITAATVEATRNDGGMYSVSVDLLENQMQYSVGDMDVTPLWDTSCDYDEAPVGGTFIRITNAYRIDGETTAQNKAAFDFEVLAAGYSYSSASFHIETAATENAAAWTDVKSSVTTHKDGHFRLLSSSLQAFVRIRWNDIASNVVANPTRSYSGEVTLESVTFNGTWTVTYSADVEDFDPSKVRLSRMEYDGFYPTDITDGATITRNSITTTNTLNGNYSFKVYYDGRASNVVYSAYDPQFDTVCIPHAAVNAIAFRQMLASQTYAVSVYAPGGDELTLKVSTDGRTWSTVTAAIDGLGDNAYTYRFNRPAAWGEGKVYAKFYFDDPIPGTEPPETQLMQATSVFELPFNSSGSLVNNGAVLLVDKVQVWVNPYFANYYSGNLDLYNSTNDISWNYVDTIQCTAGFTPYFEVPAIGTGAISDHFYKIKATGSGIESNVTRCPLLPMGE